MSKQTEMLISLKTFQDMFYGTIPNHDIPVYAEKQANDPNWIFTQYKDGFAIVPEHQMTQKLIKCNDPYWQSKI